MQKETKNQNSRWLAVSIKIGIFSSLFMPLIIGNQFIFPFIFPKQAFFQIIVEIILGLYIILALREPQYRPRFSKLFWALTAYFCVLILSSVFGANTYHSFWSNYERMAGVINLWHYFVFLFVVANVMKSKEDWYHFFDFSIIASFLAALYALGQTLGIGFFTNGIGARVDGTIGNASFLAGYMLINALFACWLIFEKKSWAWRAFYLAVIILNIFILYESQTRGALLALIVAIIALAGFFIFASKKSLKELPIKIPARLKIYLVAVLAVFILIIGSFWLARNSNFVKNNPTLRRMTNISLSEATSQTRLMAWQMTLKGFQERPVFGWGPENYYIVFNKYYNPNLYPVESWFDRSHNAYLDVLINTGIVGIIAYLSILVLAFWFLWKSWRRQIINYHTFAIFTVILAAYIIQNITLFDTQVTLLMIFSILAFVAYLSFNFSPAPAKLGRSIKAHPVLISAIAVAALFVIYFANIKPGLAGSQGIEALKLLQTGDISGGINALNEAYKIGTFGLPEVASQANSIAMQAIGNQAVSADDKKKLVEVAVDGMKKALEMEPQNVRFMLMLANLYLAATPSNQAYLGEAERTLAQAHDLSQNRQDIYYSFGQMYLFKGNAEEALGSFKKAVQLNEKAPQAHWSYGAIAIALGQKELGEAEIQKAKDAGFDYGVTGIRQLISAYSNSGDWPKVVEQYDEWLKINPTDINAYMGLANLYLQLGDREKARDAALKIAEINPAFKEQADAFIKQMGF